MRFLLEWLSFKQIKSHFCGGKRREPSPSEEMFAVGVVRQPRTMQDFFKKIQHFFEWV